MFIKTQIRNQFLETPVFLFKRFRFSQITYPHTGIFLLPGVYALLTDSHLPAHLSNRYALLDLPYGTSCLFIGIPSLNLRTPPVYVAILPHF